jgi:small nuclear ribonucleoprotein (snRNP)-like protein
VFNYQEEKMNNLKSKKFVAMTLTFVMVMALAGPQLPAKERRGSKVVVILTNGRSVEGELLAVKGHDLIIHDKSKDQGFTVNIEQVSNIKIKKKPGALTGFAIGLVAGLVTGCVLYGANKGGCPDCDLSVMFIFITPCITTPIGSLIGALNSVPKKMAINGEESVNIEESLRYLQKHARY